MSLMLPAPPAHARSLTEVMPRLWASVGGPAPESGSQQLPPVPSAIAVVVDGLGAANLAARAGHARFLREAMAKRDTALSVFPSTTASALTSLMTGAPPGRHGIVGYRVRVPGTAVLSNQLTGWETDGLDPATWQRAETLFERASRDGHACFVVSREDYRSSGFTRAAFRGSRFLVAGSFADRLSLALETARAHPGSLTYVYTPDLDALGHRAGWESDAWVAALEQVDAAARDFSRDAAAQGIGALLTADHGMVDVPRHGHVLLADGDPILDGVAALAGEPRMLHVYAEPGEAEQVAHRWRASEESRSWVLTRAEAISAGILGAVDPDVMPRLGDVLVAARARIAYYDDRLPDKGPQKMVGQHGSLTLDERLVPLIRLGAYATH
jgi:predicted AlkP superfamily pyrophosphatase or phosphodiesterase